MPKARSNNFSDNPYHVTNRCINKDWFAMPMDDVWLVMQDHLYLTQKIFNLKVHSFVLMSNHFHLLVSAPDKNLSTSMAFFLRYTSLSITKATGRINHLWARKFKRCEINSYHYFMNAYKYVYQNPIRAELCEVVEDYRYSTLRGLLGIEKLVIPVVEDTLLFEADLESNLRWLNQKATKENSEALKKALRRTIFKLAKTNKIPHKLEKDLL